MNIKIDNVDLVITREELTKIAKQIHQEIDDNGKCREEEIIEVMVAEFSEVFQDYLESGAIDWDVVCEDDVDEEDPEVVKANYE